MMFFSANAEGASGVRTERKLASVTIDPVKFVADMKAIGWPDPETSANWLVRIDHAAHDCPETLNNQPDSGE